MAARSSIFSKYGSSIRVKMLRKGRKRTRRDGPKQWIVSRNRGGWKTALTLRAPELVSAKLRKNHIIVAGPLLAHTRLGLNLSSTDAIAYWQKRAIISDGGQFPQSHSYTTAASAYWSLAGRGFPLICSGAI